MYRIYIRERYYFPIVCTPKSTMENFEVKVYVEIKGNLRLEKI